MATGHRGLTPHDADAIVATAMPIHMARAGAARRASARPGALAAGVEAIERGFCDAPAIATGQHWHCQWGMGFSMCGWKWADNTDATAPY